MKVCIWCYLFKKYDLNYIKLYGHRIFLIKHSKKQVIMVIFHKGNWKSNGKERLTFHCILPVAIEFYTLYTYHLFKNREISINFSKLNRIQHSISIISGFQVNYPPIK